MTGVRTESPNSEIGRGIVIVDNEWLPALADLEIPASILPYQDMHKEVEQIKKKLDTLSDVIEQKLMNPTPASPRAAPKDMRDELALQPETEGECEGLRRDLNQRFWS